MLRLAIASSEMERDLAREQTLPPSNMPKTCL